MTKVTLINFNDGPRVVYDINSKPRNIEIGGVVDIALTDRNIVRLKRDPAMVCLPPELVDKNQSGMMRSLLNTLRDWSSLSMDEAMSRTESVLGLGALGQRPTRPEMRMALAKRAKDAAYYIQQGSDETADDLLGKNLPPPDVQRAALVKPKEADKDIVSGDPEESDGSDNEHSRDGGSAGAGLGQSHRRLVQSEAGPGVALPASGERGGDRPGTNGGPRPQRQIRRRPEPPPQPQRVKRVVNPARNGR